MQSGVEMQFRPRTLTLARDGAIVETLSMTMIATTKVLKMEELMDKTGLMLIWSFNEMCKVVNFLCIAGIAYKYELYPVYNFGFMTSSSSFVLLLNSAATFGSSPGMSPSNHQFRSSPPERNEVSPFRTQFHFFKSLVSRTYSPKDAVPVLTSAYPQTTNNQVNTSGSPINARPRAIFVAACVHNIMVFSPSLSASRIITSKAFCARW